MEWQRREAVATHSPEQVGREAFVSRKGAVQVFAFGDFVWHLSDCTRRESMNVLDLPLALEVRDTAYLTEWLNTKPMSADNGIGRCVETGRRGVGRAVRPGTLNAPCGARGWGVYFHGLSPLFWSEDQECPRP